MDRKLLIRVYRDIAGAEDEIDIGTAYPVSDKHIITARHVVADQSNEIQPSQITLTWYRQSNPDDQTKKFRSDKTKTRVAWDGGETWDAVLLECEFPKGVDAPRGVLYGRDLEVNEIWRSEGFARTGQKENIRCPDQLKGKTFGCELHDSRLKLEVDAAAENAEDWKGVSGAPVFIHKRIVGLIADARPPFAGRVLEAIPISHLLKIPKFCSELGLPDPRERKPINWRDFRSRIERKLVSFPGLLSTMRGVLASYSIELIDDQEDDQEEFTQKYAAKLARTLIDMPFPLALRCFKKSLKHSSLGQDERDALHEILNSFSPAAYDIPASENIKFLSENPERDLIDGRAIDPIVAELRAAAVKGRDLCLDKDDQIGRGCDAILTAHPLPMGLGVSVQEEVIATVEGNLKDRLDKDGIYTGPANLYRKQIQGIVKEKQEDGDTLPYVFLNSPEKSKDMTYKDFREKLEECARKYPDIIRELKILYPEILIIHHSIDEELQEKEFYELRTFREILEIKRS